jgi:hypothetical protein
MNRSVHSTAIAGDGPGKLQFRSEPDDRGPSAMVAFMK